jgi:peptidoglycan/xylan/chitin deacetylase (PgdA/CDA1 family)
MPGVPFGVVSWAKKGVKLALLAPASVGADREPGLFVLIYHRVGAGAGLELDLPSETFHRQMRWLRDHADVVPLEAGLGRIDGGERPGRDLVAITFDDGYRDVHSRAWPALRDLGLPATLFLATGFLEGSAPAPLSRAGSPRGEEPAPLRWDQVEEMVGSGLVTVGSHSHTHPDFDGISPGQAEDELGTAGEVLARRLGAEGVATFAYPRAVVAHEEAVGRAHRWAVAGGGGKSHAGTLVRTRVARTPVRASDGTFFFRRRLAGIRPLEDRLYARLRGRADG